MGKTYTEAMTPKQIAEAMRSKAAGSALDASDVKAMRLTPIEAKECDKWKLPAKAAGFLIPYSNADGSTARFYRVRYLEDTRTGFSKQLGKKPLKYAQPVGAASLAYFPPNAGLDWEALLADAEQPLVLTEGELKAACAVRHGIPCIGLGGVWSFQSAKSGQALLPQLEEVEWKDRATYIVFDSDAATNPDVVKAEQRLARRLIERGARVHIGRIPSGDDIAEKVGLDDFIVLHGVERFRALVLDNAFEAAGSEVLHELNRKVLYVRNPGFIFEHETGQRMSPSAFKEHAYANVFITEQRVQKKEAVLVRVPAAKAWIEWPHRAEVGRVTYAPGSPRILDSGELNTWNGWGLREPIKGDVSMWARLLDHIFGADKEARKWFEAWAAYPLQNPGVKMHTAAAVWGVQHGTGKSLIGYTLLRIYGENGVELQDSHLENERNVWAGDGKQFALADDITAKGDRQMMRRLMTMVTQKTISVDVKYVPTITIPDLINYYYTSNEPDALYLEDHDRRFWIFETYAGRLAFRKEYVEWMKSDSGIAALWHHLLTLDISWFDPFEPAPVTQAKAEMITIGKSELGAWVRQLRDNPDLLLDRAGLKGDLFSSQELFAVFDASGNSKATPNALARELKRAGFRKPATGSPLRAADGSVINAYTIRNREKWMSESWKTACEHWNENRKAPGKRGKF